MSLHPSVAAVRAAVRQHLADLESGSRIVVACSGGPDSLALLAATVFEGRKAGWHVVGATVDHGLQQGSSGHATALVGQMAALGADETLSARVQVHAEGQGPEAAAREARYAVLDQVAEHLSADAVLLGHTRDDQAETVLLGLARGSGGRSIAGMRRVFSHYRRPLLDVSRADTVAACENEGIAVWTDPHNVDPAFTRVRVRTQVLPVLENELGPGVSEALARTADLLREDMELLDQLADQVPAGARELHVDALAALPSALRRRVLHRAALAAGSPAADLRYEHVRAIETLVTDWHGQRWIDLPGPRRAVRRDGRLHLLAPPFE